MSAAPLRVVPAATPAPRTTIADLIRDEFEVDLYLPPRDNAYLYGPHCSARGCERPGNELIVDHARFCQRHGQRFQQAQLSVDEFLVDPPVIAARTELTGLPRYDLTASSAVTRGELRLLMQAMHDGAFSLTFSSKRWNALRAVYAQSEQESLVDIDLSRQPGPRVRDRLGEALSAVPRRHLRATRGPRALAPRRRLAAQALRLLRARDAGPSPDPDGLPRDRGAVAAPDREGDRLAAHGCRGHQPRRRLGDGPRGDPLSGLGRRAPGIAGRHLAGAAGRVVAAQQGHPAAAGGQPAPLPPAAVHRARARRWLGDQPGCHLPARRARHPRRA